MRVERWDKPGEFLEATLAYRAAEPFRTNVMATVAASVVVDTSRYQECFWWTVHDAEGAVRGAAFWTPPHALSIGPMAAEAAEDLARYVAVSSTEPADLIGAPQLVSAFAEAFSSSRGSGAPAYVVKRRDVLYVAENVVAPTVPGEPTLATEADLDLAEAWLSDFAEEIDGVRRTPDAGRRTAMLGTLREGRLWWWSDRGEIVSMAAHNVTIDTAGTGVTRVGPVFTPPSRRRHGYAAAVTAAVTVCILDAGSKVMLFADEANATSNGVYQSIGYRAIDVFVVATAKAKSGP
jgi:predicted GNAT family acetyltransferase